MSCIWINTIADELVTLLNVMGEVFGIPKALLGLTVLAWGNSVGGANLSCSRSNCLRTLRLCFVDLVSNSLMARKGFSETALGASFTAPLVHLLVGLGVGFLYKVPSLPFIEDDLAAYTDLFLPGSQGRHRVLGRHGAREPRPEQHHLPQFYLYPLWPRCVVLLLFRSSLLALLLADCTIID